MADDDDDLQARNVRLETEKHVRETVDRERIKSDDTYAIKLIERIVFGLLAVILLGVIGALMSVIIK